MKGPKPSTPGERRAALYLLDAVGLTDKDVASIIGRSRVQVRVWRRAAGIEGKRGPAIGAPNNAERRRRWLEQERAG